VEVAPERFQRWCAGFGERHGSFSSEGAEFGIVLTAADGAIAQCYPPIGAPVGADLVEFTAAALAPHRIGLLLARVGSVAVGIADGDALAVTKVETSYVQGRTAAGGWSQQRFARRRGNQAKAAAAEAADIADRILRPAAPTLAALATGGDRRAVDAILADHRLATLLPLRADRFLEVGEPRRAALEAAVAKARAVRIRVIDPA
jgi:peptide subunit release factor 1 (eRF1)